MALHITGDAAADQPLTDNPPRPAGGDAAGPEDSSYRAGDPSSILFAMEKNGSKQLIETKRELITPDSVSFPERRVSL